MLVLLFAVVLLLFVVVVLLFVVVLLLFVVVVMMMIVVGLLLLLFLFASRVVGGRRHPLLPSPIRLPVVRL